MSIGRESEQISLTTQKSRLICILGQRRLWNSQAEYQYSNIWFRIQNRRKARAMGSQRLVGATVTLNRNVIGARFIRISTWTAFKFNDDVDEAWKCWELPSITVSPDYAISGCDYALELRLFIFQSSSPLLTYLQKFSPINLITYTWVSMFFNHPSCLMKWKGSAYLLRNKGGRCLLHKKAIETF